MKTSDRNNLLYWGSLALTWLAGIALADTGWIAFTPELDGLFFLGLFFLHMGAGHYLGYQGMLKRKYRAVPWRREYQRALGLSFALMGAGWIAGSLLPQGVGIYAVIVSIVTGLFVSNRRLGQLTHSNSPHSNYDTKE